MGTLIFTYLDSFHSFTAIHVGNYSSSIRHIWGVSDLTFLDPFWDVEVVASIFVGNHIQLFLTFIFYRIQGTGQCVSIKNQPLM